MSRVHSVFIAKVKSVGLFLVRGGKAFQDLNYRTFLSQSIFHLGCFCELHAVELLLGYFYQREAADQWLMIGPIS